MGRRRDREGSNERPSASAPPLLAAGGARPRAFALPPRAQAMNGTTESLLEGPGNGGEGPWVVEALKRGGPAGGAPGAQGGDPVPPTDMDQTNADQRLDQLRRVARREAEFREVRRARGRPRLGPCPCHAASLVPALPSLTSLRRGALSACARHCCWSRISSDAPTFCSSPSTTPGRSSGWLRLEPADPRYKQRRIQSTTRGERRPGESGAGRAVAPDPDTRARISPGGPLQADGFSARGGARFTGAQEAARACGWGRA